MNGAIRWTAIMVVGLGVLAAPVLAAETAVTVIRGTASDTASLPASAGLPTVLRGWQAGSPRSAKAPAPRRDSSGWIATGGDTLWLVERHGGRVIGCWLQGSTQAGETEIRCGHGAWR